MECERLEPEAKRIESERKTLLARIEYLRGKAAKANNKNDVPGLMMELDALERELPEPIPLPQVWTADVTPENLATIMASNAECMALLSDEGGIFDTMAGRYSSGIPNLDIYLQGHAGSPVRVNRTTRPPLYMERPCLSMGICPQPDVIRALQDKPGFRGRGLLAWYLYALPPSTLGHRVLNTRPMTDSVKHSYADVVQAMLAQSWAMDEKGKPCAHVLKLEDGAKAEWEHFKKRTEPDMAMGGTFAHLTDWASKLPGAVARIAAVLHVARHAHHEPWNRLIGKMDMEAATKLAAVLGQHALLAFDCMGADAAFEDARAILAWIRREGLPAFTRREAHVAHKHRCPRADDLRAPLDVLTERNYIRPRPQAIAGRGRPSEVFDVNPAAMHDA